MNATETTAARRAYLAADATLGAALARHRHWNSSLTAEHLEAAQQRARTAYAELTRLTA